MKDFIKILDENFEAQAQMGLELESKKEYLGSIIFNFITYDSELDELLADKMLTVLKVILEKDTFRYTEASNKNHINFITMVNMPFLIDKVNWGTSIRGAWLDNTKEYSIDCGRIKIEENELHYFIQAILDWVG